MNMSNRVRQIRKAMKKTQKEFSELLGINQATLSLMETSNGPISERYIKTICSICNTNEYWLRTGEGDMFVENLETILQQLKNELHLTEMEIDILSVYLEFSSEDRKKILSFAQDFSKKLENRLRQNRALTIDEKVAAYRAKLEAEVYETSSEKKATILSPSLLIGGNSSI